MRLQLGLGSCGIAAGANHVQTALNAVLEPHQIKVERTGCNGMCFMEPLLKVMDDEGNTYFYGKLDAAKATRIAQEHILGGQVVKEYLIASENMEFLNRQTRIVLRNCGNIDPENIEDYIAVGGYEGLKSVLPLKAEEIIEIIKESGLRGRGGAGFPTWIKWQSAYQAVGKEKYIICNADEGDPGAFMDRSVLESDPHSVIEGMIVAGLVIGAAEGRFYVRAEYPLAIKRLEIALQQAREKGLLGQNILGSGFNFDLKIAKGAGAFVCGEETALIASLEGERGMPRIKPPFPAESGYQQKPTNINNVETFANVPWILLHGSKAFAALGTENSKGTKVFAMAGKVRFGGLVEVPMGITLREVVFGIAGGIKDGKAFKGAQLGGPSGGCLPAELLDTPIDYQSLASTGAIMGSGGMIVMDETSCMVDMAKFFMNFTVNESCGKCTPCRIGTKRMLEMLNLIANGEGTVEMIDELQQLGETIKDGSLCGLGNSAPNPVLSTLRFFLDEYKAHIIDKRCASFKCKALVIYKINADKCTGCTLCAKVCPVHAIDGVVRKPHVINAATCSKCGNCFNKCKFKAIEVCSGEVCHD